MLMPLLVRVTDSQVETFDRAAAQVSNGVQDRGNIVEEVGPAGLTIHQKAPLPDLHVEPVHGDAQSRGQGLRMKFCSDLAWSS
jgi:hypothetical protein